MFVNHYVHKKLVYCTGGRNASLLPNKLNVVVYTCLQAEYHQSFDIHLNPHYHQHQHNHQNYHHHKKYHINKADQHTPSAARSRRPPHRRVQPNAWNLPPYA